MARSKLTVTGILLASSLATSPSIALAERPHPAHLAGPIVSATTAIQVTKERLELHCEERDDEPYCTFTARYQLHNPSDREEAIAAAYYGVGAEAVRVTVDGREPSPLSEDAEREIELRARQQIGTMTSTLTRWGFSAVIEPKGSASLEISGVVLPGPFDAPGGDAMRAMRARHVVFARQRMSRGYDLEVLIPLAKREMQVEVDHPRYWKFDDFSTGTAWTARPENGRVVRTASVSATTPRLLMRFELDAPVELGGPILGVGADVISERRLRMRAGWQVGYPDWLLSSLVVDTDFEDVVQIVPTVEGALPFAYFIPSFSLGFGVPVQIYREVDVGIRIQATLHGPLLGIAAGYDLFFRDGRDALWFMATLGI